MKVIIPLALVAIIVVIILILALIYCFTRSSPSTVIVGQSSVPLLTEGKVGDLYISPSGTIYGPKTSSSWPIFQVKSSNTSTINNNISSLVTSLSSLSSEDYYPRYLIHDSEPAIPSFYSGIPLSPYGTTLGLLTTPGGPSLDQLKKPNLSTIKNSGLLSAVTSATDNVHSVILPAGRKYLINGIFHFGIEDPGNTVSDLAYHGYFIHNGIGFVPKSYPLYYHNFASQPVIVGNIFSDDIFIDTTSETNDVEVGFGLILNSNLFTGNTVNAYTYFTKMTVRIVE